MSYRFYIPNDVRLLVQKYDPEQRQRIEQQISKERKYPIITVCNDAVIDGVEEFEFCLRNDIPYRINIVNLSSKSHMYSWICAKQLERADINTTMYRFLIGFQVLAEMPINGAHIGMSKFGKETAIAHVAELYSLKRQRVSWYKIFTMNLMKVNEICPELVPYILSERLLASWNNVEYLSKRKNNELYEIMEKTKILDKGEQIKFNDLMKEIDKNYKPARIKKNWIEPGSDLEIKKMPEYDPDIELKSLSLTSLSWIQSISRVDSCELKDCTRAAKKELSDNLKQLIDNANQLRRHLGVK